VAIAFPDFPAYTNLLARLGESVKKLGLQILIVRESGSVTIAEEGMRDSS